MFGMRTGGSSTSVHSNGCNGSIFFPLDSQNAVFEDLFEFCHHVIALCPVDEFAGCYEVGYHYDVTGYEIEIRIGLLQAIIVLPKYVLQNGISGSEAMRKSSASAYEEYVGLGDMVVGFQPVTICFLDINHVFDDRLADQNVWNIHTFENHLQFVAYPVETFRHQMIL